jgi:DNA polymerase/3'-5' exonuclease PolX
MSAGTRVHRQAASLIANDLVTLLQTATYRIEIAGSIRRNSPDVGDIELVAVPTRERVADGMLDTIEVNRLTERDA